MDRKQVVKWLFVVVVGAAAGAIVLCLGGCQTQQLASQLEQMRVHLEANASTAPPGIGEIVAGVENVIVQAQTAEGAADIAGGIMELAVGLLLGGSTAGAFASRLLRRGKQASFNAGLATGAAVAAAPDPAATAAALGS
jgi:hypothetical protein